MEAGDTFEAWFQLVHDGLVMVDFGTALAAPGLRINGRQIVEPAELVKAAGMKFFPRGNEMHELEVLIREEEVDEVEALAAALDHVVSVPRDGGQTVIALEDGRMWRLNDSAVESWIGVAESLVPAKGLRIVGGKMYADQAVSGPQVWEAFTNNWEDL